MIGTNTVALLVQTQIVVVVAMNSNNVVYFCEWCKTYFFDNEDCECYWDECYCDECNNDREFWERGYDE